MKATRGPGWTVQVFISGYALPEGTEVRWVSSLYSAKALLYNAWRESLRVGAGYPTEEHGGAEALLWAGRLRDVTDVYPDRRLFIGPRGGVQSESI